MELFSNIMENSHFSSLQSSISQSGNISVFSEEELSKILSELNITGEIKDKNHALVTYIKAKWKKLKTSRIQNSYTNREVKWKEFKKDEDKIYLFRISKKVSNNIKELIKKEYKINSKCKEFSPEFICYFFSSFFNFSVFIVNDYYTLEEILEKKKLPDFSDKESLLEFSNKDLLLAMSNTIKNLYLEDSNNCYIIFPFLTPSNFLYTEESGKEYFFISEIFLFSDSNAKEVEIELDISKEWFVPEFNSNKAKVSFASNIYCLGNLFYKFAFNKKPFKDEQERNKLGKVPLIKENSKYKELIEMCLKKNPKERCSIDDIINYIYEKIDEENPNEDIDNINESNNELKDISINNISNIQFNQSEINKKEIDHKGQYEIIDLINKIDNEDEEKKIKNSNELKNKKAEMESQNLLQNNGENKIEEDNIQENIGKYDESNIFKKEIKETLNNINEEGYDKIINQTKENNIQKENKLNEIKDLFETNLDNKKGKDNLLIKNENNTYELTEEDNDQSQTDKKNIKKNLDKIQEQKDYKLDNKKENNQISLADNYQKDNYEVIKDNNSEINKNIEQKTETKNNNKKNEENLQISEMNTKNNKNEELINKVVDNDNNQNNQQKRTILNEKKEIFEKNDKM